jgi:hypothetical protein
MNKVRAFALILLAFPLGVGVSVAASGENHQGDGLPGCGPSHNTPKKCHTTSTQTVTTPGTTTTVTQPGTTTTVTVPAPPTPPPVVVVTPGPTSSTVSITITINGAPVTVTVPGFMPGSKPSCVNTRKSAILGPLPRRFTRGMRVSITSFGHTQFQRVRAQHKVFVNLRNVPCGVFPMVIRRVPGKPGFKPALRIWSLTGGNGLQRFWFPGIPGVSH